MTDLLARVRALADDVLFPAAGEVDRTGVVPASHWDRLAHEGLYGVACPPDLGGPGLDLATIGEVLETMAGGCLATTFTWLQHHGVVLGLAMSPNTALRDEHLAALVSGRTRGGVAFAGVIPDPPCVQAVRTAHGWLLTGDAPFVGGWGIVDVLQVSAGDADSGDVIEVLVEAREQPGITRVEPQRLVAADATRTVSLRLDDLDVGDDRVVPRSPRAQFLANQVIGAASTGRCRSVSSPAVAACSTTPGTPTQRAGWVPSATPCGPVWTPGSPTPRRWSGRGLMAPSSRCAPPRRSSPPVAGRRS